MTTVELAVDDLRSRVERLERIVDRQQEVRSEPTPNDGPLDQAELMVWLKAQGLIVELPPEAKAHAARWRALPEEEKLAHVRFMDSLVLDPPLSQLIIDARR